MADTQISRRIRFTDRSLRAIKPPPRPKQLDYYDDSFPGFGLRVSYRGRKSWIVLCRCNGVKGRLTLGRFDLLPLVTSCFGLGGGLIALSDRSVKRMRRLICVPAIGSK